MLSKEVCDKMRDGEMLMHEATMAALEESVTVVNQVWTQAVDKVRNELASVDCPYYSLAEDEVRDAGAIIQDLAEELGNLFNALNTARNARIGVEPDEEEGQ